MTSTRAPELPSIGFDADPRPPRRPILPIALTTCALLLAASVFGRGDRLAQNAADVSADTSPTTTIALSLATWNKSAVTIDRPMAETLHATGSGGFAMLSGIGADAWLSPDGVTWAYRPLESAGRGFISEDDLLGVFRDTTIWWLEGERHSDASTELPVLVRRGQMSERPGVSLFGGRLLVESPDGELYAETSEGTFQVVVPQGVWSRDPQDPWEAATAPRRPNSCRPPRSGSIDQVPIVEFEGGLLAFVSGGEGRPHGIWPLCIPWVWTSPDGIEWERATEDSPFADSTYVYDVASDGTSLMAVGGAGADRPALWHSFDGLRWSRRPIMGIPGFSRYEPTQIDAGPAGWVIIGEDSSGAGSSGWVSIDGRCWEPMPSDVQPRGAAVGTDVISVVAADGTVWAVEPGQTC